MLSCFRSVIDKVNERIQQFRAYCQAMAGTPVPIAPDGQAKARLPLFLGRAYEPLRGELFAHQWVFLCHKGRLNPTPAEAASHARLAATTLNADVVLVFWTLASFDRRRLVQKRVPFIVPGHQVFLPGTFINLKEHGVGSVTADPPGNRLSMPGQVLLLSHLLRRIDKPRMPLHEWADALGYSRMTLSRAAEELLDAGVAEKTGQGRAVLLGFGLDRRQLWDRAVPRLASPVGKRVNVITRGRELPGALEAGMTALAHYSDIAPMGQQILAMPSSAFASAKRNGLIETLPHPDANTAMIERWRYAPALLSKDGRTVDPLSLYLSLRETKDERVEGALKQLLQAVPW